MYSPPLAHPLTVLLTAWLLLTGAAPATRADSRIELIVGFGHDGRSWVVIERTVSEHVPPGQTPPPAPVRVRGKARLGGVTQGFWPTTHRLLQRWLGSKPTRQICPPPSAPAASCPTTQREALAYPGVRSLRLLAPLRPRLAHRAFLLPESRTVVDRGDIVIRDRGQVRLLGRFRQPQYMAVVARRAGTPLILGPRGHLVLVEGSFQSVVGGVGRGSGASRTLLLPFVLPPGGVSTLKALGPGAQRRLDVLP